MASIRPHPTDPAKLIADISTHRRQQLVCDTVEEVIEKMKLDPSFIRFDNPPFTIRQLAARYERRCKADGLRSMRTVEREFRVINRALGDRVAFTIQPGELMVWAAKLSETYALNTVCGYISLLASVFREAVQAEILWSDPTPALRAAYKRDRAVKATFPTDDEEARMRASAHDVRSRVILGLLLDIGLFANEIAPLKNRDFDGKVIHISMATDDKKVVVPAMDHRCRRIPLTQELIGDLVVWQSETGGAPEAPLLPGTKNEAMSISALERCIAKIQVRAGLGRTTPKYCKTRRTPQNFPRGDYKFHELSSRAAVKWLRSGVNAVLVMRRMGYGAYSTFARRYSAVLGALPDGPDISSVDDLIWGSVVPDSDVVPEQAETKEH